MGAIEYRRLGLLMASIMAVALLWLLVNPTDASAGSWRSGNNEYVYHGHDDHEHDYYDYYDKYDDSSCECSGADEDADDSYIDTDCEEDPTVPIEDNSGQGGDDPTDPADPEDPALELRIDQQVQVMGGAFVDAEDDATAPEGQIGDPVVWQVTVGVDEAAEDEDRTVKITWDEPENVDVTGSEVTSGTFDGTTWTVGIGNMPATLTVKSVLNGAGLGVSTARIAEISCDDSGAVDADGFCDFEDNVNANNANPAGVLAMATDDGESDPAAAPGVLGATTSRPPQGGGNVLRTQTTGGRVLGDRALAATGVNSMVAFLVGGLLTLAPAFVRVRK